MFNSAFSSKAFENRTRRRWMRQNKKFRNQWAREARRLIKKLKLPT